MDIRSTTIIQVQNLNLKLNMTDINKILAKAQAETCLCEAVGSLPVFCKCGEPWLSASPLKVVSLNPSHGEVYSIQYCDKICQWLAAGQC